MGPRQAVDGAIYHRLGHLQQMPHRLNFRVVVRLHMLTTIPHRGRGTVDREVIWSWGNS